ncbi:MAG: FeoB-associated Cys-rich membrane protein [Lachnospiraceae bacterium]|nr:FeoB-associated Cys-rich membrane protein [Lachnospiraceae bacterium]
METILVNVIAALIIVCLVGAASYYIYKEKKKGTRCIGCPMAGNCSKAKAAKECSSMKDNSSLK